MHRTLYRPWSLMSGLLLAWIVGGFPADGRAQSCPPPPGHLVVVLNGTIRLQLSSKKPIKTVTNPKEGIVGLRTVERDPTTILVTGQAPGVTCLELEDADNNKESYKIIVQADMEYLNFQLKKAVPLANITPVPNGVGQVILTGYVTRAEDIPVAQAVAQGAGFLAVNGLRVGGVQQVQLDVVVARVKRTKGRNFGFNFLQNSRNEFVGSTVGNLIPALGNVGVPGTNLQPARFGQLINSAPSQANVFGGIIGPNSGFLWFLQALETEGLAKLLARPRLVTRSGAPASFLDGGEQAVPVPAGLGQVGVQFEEFGTRLNFLPIVLGNGRIFLEVEPEVSALDASAGTSVSGTVVPGRATQRVHTSVEMESGQTFVIGGLIQHTVTGTATKIPVLGQIPFLGVAFSTKSFSEDETELIVMVTPHLVDAQSCDQVVKVLPGQESRSPDDFELFLEGILEAPRGPRAVFHGPCYVPAHMNGPTADLFPCAGRTALGPGGGVGGYPSGCANGACGNGGPAPAPVAAPLPVAPAEGGPAVLAPQAADPLPTGGQLSAETPRPAALPAALGASGGR
jgi:pilus assembly protein CpaC